MAGKIGHIVTEETREKIRQKKLGQKHTPEALRKISESGKGRIPVNKGKHHTPEALAKMRGRVASQETREKNRQANLGKKQSPETIEKRRLKIIGHVTSEETKRKISESQIGKIIPDDVKEKIRIARARQIMKPVSEETKKKIGDKNRGKKYGPMTLEAKQHLREMNSGSRGAGWKGGIADANGLIRTSLEYREWRRMCMERDWFRCQISGYKGKDIIVHHINNFADYPELRMVVDNGITLSRTVHQAFHAIYGNKNNTQEQLDEFINNYASTDKINFSGGTESDIRPEVTETSGDSEISA